MRIFTKQQSDILTMESILLISSREQFTNKSYTVCLENYYTENEAVPGLEAENEAHTAIFLPFDDMLRQEITLFSTGSIEDNSRVKLFADRLTSEVYKEILNRIESWFGEGELV